MKAVLFEVESDLSGPESGPRAPDGRPSETVAGHLGGKGVPIQWMVVVAWLRTPGFRRVTIGALIALTGALASAPTGPARSAERVPRQVQIEGAGGSSSAVPSGGFSSWAPTCAPPASPSGLKNRKHEGSSQSSAAETAAMREGRAAITKELDAFSNLPGPARAGAAAALWRQFDAKDLSATLLARLRSGALKDAAVSVEVLAEGGPEALIALMEVFTSRDAVAADRAACAIAEIPRRAEEKTVGRLVTRVGGTLAGVTAEAARMDGSRSRPAPVRVSGVSRLRSAWTVGALGTSASAIALGRLSLDADPAVRSVAVDALARMNPAIRRDRLELFSLDDVSSIRIRTAEGYRTDATSEATVVLKRMTQDRDPGVRSAALASLIALPRDCSQELVDLLKDPEPGVRRQAAHHLARIGGEQKRMELLKSPDLVVREAAWEGMRDDPGLSIRILASLSQYPDPTVRRYATSRLMNEVSPEARRALASFLGDPQQDVQMEVLDWLTSQQPPPEASVMVPLAKGSAQSVQHKAVSFLLSQQGMEYTRALTHFLEIKDQRLKVAMVARLGERHAPDFVPLMAALSSDPDATLRSAALAAVIRMPYPTTGAVIEGFLNDASSQIRIEAIRALGARRDPVSVIALISLDQDPDPGVRREVLRAMDRVGDDVAAGAIALYLHDESPSIRRDALEILARMKSPMALGFVGEVFSSQDEALRRRAIAVLQKSGDNHPALAAQQLSWFLHDPVPEVQALAIWACGSTGAGEAVAGLVRLSEERDSRVRLEAVTALRSINDQRVVGGLEHFVADAQSEIRAEAYQGLARATGQDGLRLLTAGLGDQDPDVRLGVIQHIGTLRLSQAVPYMIASLDKAPIAEQKAIIEALGTIRSTDSIGKLLDLTASGGIIQQLMARRALDRPLQSDQEVRQLLDRTGSPLIEVTVEAPGETYR